MSMLTKVKSPYVVELVGSVTRKDKGSTDYLMLMEYCTSSVHGMSSSLHWPSFSSFVFSSMDKRIFVHLKQYATYLPDSSLLPLISHFL